MKNVVTREDRIADYATMKGPQGAGRDERNLDYWVARTARNSEIAPRAADGPMKLPSTKVDARDTAMKPYVSRDVRAMAKSDLNHSPDSSPFLKSIRRGQS